MIDRSTIDRIMATSDIVDVVKDFVSLRKSGQNYKGLCPFHNEKTPSFMVSPSKQLCKCFSCGKGGNVVKFLMEHEQLTYPEALKWLGKKYGIEVRDKEQTAEQRAAATERDSMFVVNEFARDYFCNVLRDTVDGMAVGLSYFRRRGLRDDIIRKFQLGYSPEDRQALSREARAKGYEEKYLVKTGLCIKREGDGTLFDRYYGRVIFPVHTISGRVVAFGGRSLLSKEEQKRRSIGKYVNSPESEIYNKRCVLYGLYQAKQAIARQDRVYLVEGYLDVISMHQSGVENVVASSGTSLTSEQVRLIHRFTNNVTVLYDGDAAGIHAALRGVDMLLSEGLNIKVLLLPDGEDPDSFAQSHSPEELQTYIEAHQTDFIRFKTDLLLRDAQGDPTRRAAVIKDIVSSIAVIPDNIVRQEYIHQFAGQMGIDENTIVNEVIINRKRIHDGEREEAAREAGRQRQSGDTPPPVPDEPPIFDDEGNIVNAPASGPTQGPAANVVTQSDITRFTQKSKAQRLLDRCEELLVESVIRYGGLPVILLPEEVERKFGGGIRPGAAKIDGESPDSAEDAAETNGKLQNLLIEDPDSPVVATYVNDSLQNNRLALRHPLYQRILDEATQLAEEALQRRREMLEKGVTHRDAPPFFDSLNHFKMHPDAAIAAEAERLTDDRYILSSSQSKMYVPDERRLVDIIPRIVNDYAHAVISVEKEQIVASLRNSTLQADDHALRSALSRLQELNEIETRFAAALGGRVINP